jgi:hypothetical protein
MVKRVVGLFLGRGKWDKPKRWKTLTKRSIFSSAGAKILKN